jgi:hypothetical protein
MQSICLLLCRRISPRIGDCNRHLRREESEEIQIVRCERVRATPRKEECTDRTLGNQRYHQRAPVMLMMIGVIRRQEDIRPPFRGEQIINEKRFARTLGAARQAAMDSPLLSEQPRRIVRLATHADDFQHIAPRHIERHRCPL